MMVKEYYFDDVFSIDWLSNVGNDTLLTCKNFHNLNIAVVDKFENNLEKSSESLRWINTLVEFSNEIFEFNKENELSNLYNELVLYIKSTVMPKLMEVLKNKYSSNLIELFNYVIVLPLICMYYKKEGFENIPCSFLDFYKILENGNLPCGWLGKIGRGGTLITY